MIVRYQKNEEKNPPHTPQKKAILQKALFFFFGDLGIYLVDMVGE
jgi:hypothetical protein